MGRAEKTTVVVTVHEAKTHLSKLLARVSSGERITIARGQRPVARLVPLDPVSVPRKPGKAKVTIGDDFDDPLPPELARGFGQRRR